MKVQQGLLFALLVGCAAALPRFRSSAGRFCNGAGTEEHAWQGSLYKAMAEKPMKDLLVPGSHDAGIMTSSGIAFGKGQGQTITQKYSIADQMCRGFRFFDIRIKKKQADSLKKKVVPETAPHTWNLLHPGFTPVPDGWADTWDNTWLDIKKYLDDPEHEHEVVQLRFKAETDKAKINTQGILAEHQEFLDKLSAQVKTYAIQTKNKRLADMKYKELSAQNEKKGRVAVILYKFSKTGYTGEAKNLVETLSWDFDENYSGKYSQSYKASFMFTHQCNKGEIAGLPGKLTCKAKRDKKNNGPGQFGSLETWSKKRDTMFIFYFTWTFGNIFDNYQHKLNKKYPNILNDATVATFSNFETMGTVLMSDFCGDERVWSKQVFKTNGGAIQTANGRSLASLVVYINKQRLTSQDVVAKTPNAKVGLMPSGQKNAMWFTPSMDSDPFARGKQKGLMDTTDGSNDAEMQKAVAESPPGSDCSEEVGTDTNAACAITAAAGGNNRGSMVTIPVSTTKPAPPKKEKKGGF